jgi:Flp pilus assembly protein TadG
MGCVVDQHDELDALRLMSIGQKSGIARCDSATTAVEFALVLPALVTLLAGGVYAGLVMYSVAGLQSAVEQAARCYSVNLSQCGSASATQTYAQSEYYGISSPTFTASLQSCGHQVAGSVDIRLTAAIVANLSVPLSATACFP